MPSQVAAMAFTPSQSVSTAQQTKNCGNCLKLDYTTLIIDNC